jgi:hypothetical protein
LTPVPDDGDLVAVKTANAAPNKLDTYLQRSLRYDVELDPGTGAIRSTATVTLTNTAPAEGLPDSVGTNRGIVRGDPGAPPRGTAIQYLSLYSPLTLTESSYDGQPASVEQQKELQRNVYSVKVSLAPGESKEVTFELEGRYGGDYHLIVDHQPTARADEVEVVVRRPAGYEPVRVENLDEVDGGDLVYQGQPRRDVTVSVGWQPD